MKKTFCVILSALLLLPAIPVRAEGISVCAASAILMTAEGEVLFEKDADAPRPMASTTKIMTAYVVAKSCAEDGTVKVTKESAGIEGTSLYMKAGDTATVRDLLYATMLRSANDAASALAIHAAGSVEAFADLMNEEARALGMTNTHFDNPHGLPSDSHFSTARDMARLAAAALENELFKRIVSTKEYVVTLNGADKRPVRNHNRLLFSYDGAIGVKTGFTKSSGRCLVSAAERDGIRLVCVTLSDPDDWRDHEKLLDFGFSSVERVSIAPGEISKTFHLFGNGSVTAQNDEEFGATLAAGTPVVFTVEGERFPAPPVKKGDVLASVTVSADGKVIGKLYLRAKESVPFPKKKTLFEKLRELIT